MKKDIDTFIAEERAEILSKYDRVRPLLVLRLTQETVKHSKWIDMMVEHSRNMSVVLWLFQGRREGVNIDPWEDADFNIYKVTDRFGFLQ